MLYKTSLLKSISYLLVFVKNFLTKSYFPKFCKELKTGTIRSSFQKKYLRFSILRYSRSVSHIFNNLSWWLPALLQWIFNEPSGRFGCTWWVCSHGLREQIRLNQPQDLLLQGFGCLPSIQTMPLGVAQEWVGAGLQIGIARCGMAQAAQGFIGQAIVALAVV